MKDDFRYEINSLIVSVWIRLFTRICHARTSTKSLINFIPFLNCLSLHDMILLGKISAAIQVVHIPRKRAFQWLDVCCCYLHTGSSHYDVLGVKESASVKEIKTAFIKRSKELHPDTKQTQSRQDHDRFVRVVQAYEVLRNRAKRREYDQELKSSRKEATDASYSAGPGTYQRPQKQHQWMDAFVSGYKFPKQGRVYTGMPNYYGVRGWSRVSNRTFVGFCVVLILFGVFLHFMSYRFSIFLRSLDVQRHHIVSAERYLQVRERASDADRAEDVLLRLYPEEPLSRIQQEAE